jgi:hypothetical protein
LLPLKFNNPPRLFTPLLKKLPRSMLLCPPMAPLPLLPAPQLNDPLPPCSPPWTVPTAPLELTKSFLKLLL